VTHGAARGRHSVRIVASTEREVRKAVAKDLGGAICLEGTPGSTYRVASELREGHRTSNIGASVTHEAASKALEDTVYGSSYQHSEVRKAIAEDLGGAICLEGYVVNRTRQPASSAKGGGCRWEAEDADGQCVVIGAV